MCFSCVTDYFILCQIAICWSFVIHFINKMSNLLICSFFLSWRHGTKIMFSLILKQIQMSSQDFFLLMVVTFIAFDTNYIKISICFILFYNIPYKMITCKLQIKKKISIQLLSHLSYQFKLLTSCNLLTMPLCPFW